MAINRIDQLTASTTLASTDLEVKEADPTGTKTHQYITALNKIRGYFKLNQWLKDPSISNPGAGYMSIYPDSNGFFNTLNESGNVRKLQPIRYVPILVFGATTTVAIGDGKAYFPIMPDLAGTNLVFIHAYNITAGTTGTQDIQVRNVTDSVDMLSTKLTTDSTEKGSDTAATPYVIDGSHDDVAAYDVLAIDIDAVHTTPGTGLIVTLGFQYP